MEHKKLNKMWSFSAISLSICHEPKWTTFSRQTILVYTSRNRRRRRRLCRKSLRKDRINQLIIPSARCQSGAELAEIDDTKSSVYFYANSFPFRNGSSPTEHSEHLFACLPPRPDVSHMPRNDPKSKIPLLQDEKKLPPSTNNKPARSKVGSFRSAQKIIFQWKISFDSCNFPRHSSRQFGAIFMTVSTMAYWIW